MINDKGNIWREINFTPYLEKEAHFELMRSSTPFQFNDTTLIFSLEYTTQNNPIKTKNDLIHYRSLKYTAPILFKIDNIFNDSLSVQFGLGNLYNNFTDSNHVAIEGNYFSFFENQIIFKSTYSDSLYFIDPSALLITEKTRLESEYGQLYVNPITVEEQLKNPEAINSNFRSNGQIRNIFF